MLGLYSAFFQCTYKTLIRKGMNMNMLEYLESCVGIHLMTLKSDCFRTPKISLASKLCVPFILSWIKLLPPGPSLAHRRLRRALRLAESWYWEHQMLVETSSEFSSSKWHVCFHLTPIFFSWLNWKVAIVAPNKAWRPSHRFMPVALALLQIPTRSRHIQEWPDVSWAALIEKTVLLENLDQILGCLGMCWGYLPHEALIIYREKIYAERKAHFLLRFEPEMRFLQAIPGSEYMFGMIEQDQPIKHKRKLYRFKSRLFSNLNQCQAYQTPSGARWFKEFGSVGLGSDVYKIWTRRFKMFFSMYRQLPDM